MSEWMKLIECKQTPSPIFTIFDYTKIVYPIESALCIRQVVTSGEKPSFIFIDHQMEEIQYISSLLNTIVTLQVYKDMYSLVFYDISGDYKSVKLNWELEGNLKVTCLNNNGTFIIVASSPNGNQVLFVDGRRKTIIGKGFFQKEVQELKNGPLETLSVLTTKGQVIVYAFQSLQKGVGRLYKDRSYTSNYKLDEHCWVEEELLIREQKQIKLIIGNQVCLQLNQFYRPSKIVPIIYGFMVIDGCVLKVFKKVDTNYSFQCQINDPYLMECKNALLSPQEDIFAYYCPKISSIIYCSTIIKQISQATMLSHQKFGASESLRTKEIGHSKSFKSTMFSSKQSWFVVTNGSQIIVYSTSTFEPYIKLKVQKEQEKELLGTSIKIRDIAIHPNRPIIAVAFDKKIRLYYIMFNEFKVLKDINCSLIKELVFNNSGSMLAAIMRGKNGTKVYLYRVNEIQNDFSLVESLSTGKNTHSFCWNCLDSSLYGFHDSGYFEWGISHLFKIRNENTVKLGFEVSAGAMASNDRIIVWGKNEAVLIKNNEIEEKISSKQQIKQIFNKGQFFVFVLSNGIICKNKDFSIDDCIHKGYNLQTNENSFEIHPLQNNKFIFVSEEFNLKFYVWNKDNVDFSQYTVIEKNKIVKLLKQYEEYEDKIKILHEKLNVTVEELKYEFKQKIEEREENYILELQNRMKAEKQIKQQKVKIEMQMQKNLQVKEKQSMRQVRDLERLYERKIALTTNKLITTTEMAFRDKILADQNLKELENVHDQNIEDIRHQFGFHVQKLTKQKDSNKISIFQLKQEYQTRIMQLEQENQLLLKRFQEKSEDKNVFLRRTITEWEIKYRQCLSKKDNVDQQLIEQQLSIKLLKQKIGYFQMRKMESDRRNELMEEEVKRLQGFLQDRNRMIQCHEKRVEDLEKSNEILKYRVHELKNLNDPQEQEIKNLKINLTDLQQEHQDIEKHSHNQEQIIEVIKKEKNKLKQENNTLIYYNNKISKSHTELVEKMRQTAKSPIQSIRKQLIKLVQKYATTQSTNSIKYGRPQSTLGELNRIRDHLEVCLDEVVTSNKKNEEQKKKQITKKYQENSQLLKQLNELRIKLKKMEDEAKERERTINKLSKGENSITRMTHKDFSSFQTHSKDLTRTKPRDSFYEKNVYKTNFREKRLKTEQGSRRKKSAYSMIRDKSHNGPLIIQNSTQDVEEYKRIIEQKDIFIQRLISKIQNN